MALTYGFFNSVDGDRKYNAEQMSRMFEGLIGNGVFNNIGSKFQVTAGTGMQVVVGSGRAMIEGHWVKTDAAEALDITASSVSLNRWTAVVLELDLAKREITIKTVDGESATEPVKPAMTRNATVYQMCLAYVYVPAGSEAVTQSNITDTRANSSLCGWVTGIVSQVDTETLFAQWEAAYAENIENMADWETDMRAAFDTWFKDLTDELHVDTYLKTYSYSVVIDETYNVPEVYFMDIAGYSYDDSDVIEVYVNGLRCSTGSAAGQWELYGTRGIIVHFTPQAVGDEVHVEITKGIIGVPA